MISKAARFGSLLALLGAASGCYSVQNSGLLIGDASLPVIAGGSSLTSEPDGASLTGADRSSWSSIEVIVPIARPANYGSMRALRDRIIGDYPSAEGASFGAQESEFAPDGALITPARAAFEILLLPFLPFFPDSGDIRHPYQRAPEWDRPGPEAP